MEKILMPIPIVTHASNDTEQPPNPLTAIERACAERGLEPKVVDGTLAVFHNGEPVAGLHIDHPAGGAPPVVKLTLAGVKGADRKYTTSTRSTNAIVRTVLAHVTERQIRARQDAHDLAIQESLRDHLERTFAGLGVSVEDYQGGPLACQIDEDEPGILLTISRALTVEQLRAMVTAAVACGLQPASQRARVPAAHVEIPVTVEEP
jgi:hypothetical protein